LQRHRLALGVKTLLQRRQGEMTALTRRLRHPRERLEQARQRTDDLTLRLMQAARLQVERRRMALVSPRERVGRWPRESSRGRARARLDALIHDMIHARRADQERRRQRLEALLGRLQALSVQGVLERGFAIVRDGQGRIVRNAASVSLHQEVHVRLAKGEVTARVTQQVETCAGWPQP
ncbi:MAG: hypothetical protein H7831_14580, partial [Magnetococcus sp. WYHC-3]